MQKPAAKQLIEFVHQALVLSIRYDAVIANPPYMGSKGMNAGLKDFAKKNYPNSKSDLFAIFMERAFKLLSQYGFNAQINMQSWMFLSSYEQLRSNLLEDHTFITMAHLGARAFSQISGEVVQTTAWIIRNQNINKYQPTFYRLIDGNEEEKKKHCLIERMSWQRQLRMISKDTGGLLLIGFPTHLEIYLYLIKAFLTFPKVLLDCKQVTRIVFKILVGGGNRI